MKRVMVWMAAVTFLLLSWLGLGFSETDKSVEGVMNEEGYITEQEYNASKKSNLWQEEKQLLQVQQPASSSGNQQQNRLGELGVEISHITYKEPDIMEQKGMMYGIVGSYASHSLANQAPKGINRWMSKIEGRFSFGQIDYDGALDDGTPYTVEDINDYILEGRFFMGYDFPVGKAIIFTPYAGLGYRYLYDGMGKDPAGYDRESNYFYSPIGIETTIQLPEGWSIGPTIEYDIFWHGWQITHYEDLNPLIDALENDQKGGYGVRGSIKIQKKTRNLDFVIEPFIRYWNIKRSENSDITILGTYVIGYGWEPENNSTEIGCRLAVKF
jgi:hypothetical protein